MNTLFIVAYCLVCWAHTYQDFESEDERFEYYRFRNCKQIHAIAVR